MSPALKHSGDLHCHGTTIAVPTQQVRALRLYSEHVPCILSGQVINVEVIVLLQDIYGLVRPGKELREGKVRTLRIGNSRCCKEQRPGWWRTTQKLQEFRGLVVLGQCSSLLTLCPATDVGSFFSFFLVTACYQYCCWCCWCGRNLIINELHKLIDGL
eukprot:GHUV01041486.1.p1 GENE.GHUV01041486.1~~GHUV01041486.1.p1  ORF type:complete len:158 (+),score=16.50 GHUV01041486.1:244-717(+)